MLCFDFRDMMYCSRSIVSNILRLHHGKIFQKFVEFSFGKGVKHTEYAKSSQRSQRLQRDHCIAIAVFSKLVPGTMVPTKPHINGFITFLLTPAQQDLGDFDSLVLILI
ncbi:hypothetical protein PoB_002596100 [Plakobranchus ocellatus]|uniref:Uncharacterized protein n=1 Tax=Plakobranchus ocellatus TaxID=259542 RepID=A0AAV3ZK30_9GAST|nr:hypothetical protein PoB_002596100 [Plakobranchus ocellatus]